MVGDALIFPHKLVDVDLLANSFSFGIDHVNFCTCEYYFPCYATICTDSSGLSVQSLTTYFMEPEFAKENIQTGEDAGVTSITALIQADISEKFQLEHHRAVIIIGLGRGKEKIRAGADRWRGVSEVSEDAEDSASSPRLPRAHMPPPHARRCRLLPVRPLPFSG